MTIPSLCVCRKGSCSSRMLEGLLACSTLPALRAYKPPSGSHSRKEKAKGLLPKARIKAPEGLTAYPVMSAPEPGPVAPSSSLKENSRGNTCGTPTACSCTPRPAEGFLQSFGEGCDLWWMFGFSKLALSQLGTYNSVKHSCHTCLWFETALSPGKEE